MKGRSASQEYFLDPCWVLNQKTPAEVGELVEWCCFERSAGKAEGGDMVELAYTYNYKCIYSYPYGGV